MEPYQRIEHLIAITSSGNRSAFAKRINTKPQTINTLLQRKGKPSLSLIENIIEAFPTINVVWLVTGEGEVGIDSNERNQTINVQNRQQKLNHDNPEVIVLTEKIKSLEREIELLQHNLVAQEQVVAAKDLLIHHLQKIST